MVCRSHGTRWDGFFADLKALEQRMRSEVGPADFRRGECYWASNQLASGRRLERDARTARARREHGSPSRRSA